jgi:hypothetical protein
LFIDIEELLNYCLEDPSDYIGDYGELSIGNMIEFYVERDGYSDTPDQVYGSVDDDYLNERVLDNIMTDLNTKVTESKSYNKILRFKDF